MSVAPWESGVSSSDRLVRPVRQHRQVREVVQAEAARAPPPFVGVVEAREGDGEEGPAFGLVLPDGGPCRRTDRGLFLVGVFFWRGCRSWGEPSLAGSESEGVGSEAVRDVRGVGVDDISPAARAAVVVGLLDAARGPCPLRASRRTSRAAARSPEVLARCDRHRGVPWSASERGSGGRGWPAPGSRGPPRSRRQSSPVRVTATTWTAPPRSTERLPQRAVRGRPPRRGCARDWRRRPASAVSVIDEGGGRAVAGDGELEREVAPGGALREREPR